MFTAAARTVFSNWLSGLTSFPVLVQHLSEFQYPTHDLYSQGFTAGELHGPLVAVPGDVRESRRVPEEHLWTNSAYRPNETVELFWRHFERRQQPATQNHVPEPSHSVLCA